MDDPRISFILGLSGHVTVTSWVCWKDRSLLASLLSE